MVIKNKILVAGNISNIYEVLVEDGNSKESIEFITMIEEEIDKINNGEVTDFEHLYYIIDDLLNVEGDVDYIVREINEMLDSIKHAEKVSKKTKVFGRC